MNLYYEEFPNGHEWEKNDDGSINVTAFFSNCGVHNGPKCVKCGYGFCHHCFPIFEYGKNKCKGKADD